MSQSKQWTHDELMLFPPDVGIMQMHREEVFQKRLRVLAIQETQVESSGQLVLIAADESIKKDEELADLSDVKSYWLTKLSSIPRRFGITELADILEETDWFASDFQKASKSWMQKLRSRIRMQKRPDR